MLKPLLVVALLISAVNAQTEVLIYQARTAVKRIGDGYEVSASFQEFLVWNLDDNHLSQIIFAKSGTDRRSPTHTRSSRGPRRPYSTHCSEIG